MCGIAGYIGLEKIDPPIITRTLGKMKNRGPDHQDYTCFQQGEVNVYLLHSRLSIIDLDRRSNQPFTFSDCTLVFNGEIYNYIEVREQLKKLGHDFETDSDTEVLLKAYLEYGEECVKHFEGMWAFAIWDNRHEKLFLSRDRFAEKPLYFMKTSSGLYIGSEVKFIRSLYGRELTVNQKHLLRYLVLGYKSLYKTEETFYNEIREIKYATSFVVTPDLKARAYRYWVPSCKIDDSISNEEAIEDVRQRLLESVRIRLRADVPMAFCLSGGVDSAALTSIAANHFNYNVSSFSIIDSDERYNEYDNIKATVDHTGCESTLINLSYDNVLPRLRKLISYHDAPVATITYFVHSMLSERISADGYRVAFSGTSADELFTGYYDHFLLHLDSVRNSPGYTKHLGDWQEHLLPFVRNPILRNAELYKDDPNYRAHVFDNSDEFRFLLQVPFNEQFTEEMFVDDLLRNRMMNELFHEATPVILHEDDLNSMLYSVENRSPFLDSRLFDYAFSVPGAHLIQNGYGKYILRESMKGILNDQVRLDRRKKGFNASINSLFDFTDPETRAFFLDGDSLLFDLIDKDKVRGLLDINPAPNHYSKFLFSFINVKLFLEQHQTN